MTKDKLKSEVLAGRTLREILPVTSGQCCEIAKAPAFRPGDDVIYVTDLWLRDIPTDEPIHDPDVLADLMDMAYTGNDFIRTCQGDARMAAALFGYVDWQHPGSALPELLMA